jgi:hypothetical protein
MRAACTISRLIDRRRPRRLTQEQSASVDDDPSVRSLLNRREQLKLTVPSQTFQQASQVKPAGWLEWSLIRW